MHSRHSSNTIMTVWTASKQQSAAQQPVSSLDEALLDRLVQRIVTPASEHAPALAALQSTPLTDAAHQGLDASA